MICEKCGAKLPDNTKFCTSCGAYFEPPKYREQHDALQYQDPYHGFPMKWHKFLIYFGLWAAAVVNLYSAVKTLVGSNYGADTSEFYSQLPSIVRVLDIIYAVIVLGIAALQIVTVVRLIWLKRDAPKLLLRVYIINCASSLIYTIIIYAVVSKGFGFMQFFSPSLVVNITISGIMIFANTTYYKKREALFVN